MKLLRFGKLRFLSGKSSLFITPVLVLFLIFQFFTPKSSELTAAGSESTVSVKNEITKTISEPEPVSLEKITASLKRGSNLHSLLINAGVVSNEANAIIMELSPHVDLTRMKAGQKVELYFDKNMVDRVILPASIEREIRVERVNEGVQEYKAHEILKDLTVYPMKKVFSVESSLYQSASDAGIPDAVIMDLIMLFSFDVDYQRDIQKGDRFEATYEQVYDETGKMVDTGNILQAKLNTNGKEFNIYRFVSAEGKTDYYDENGHTVRKTLLKTPINGAYITSNYGMRINPFSGYTTMHKGVDFGAPRGTPIKASGDGTVTYAGYSDVYGNYVMIRHVNNYVTLYAHMTAFARGLRRGTRVDQGSVIGYVGTTGMSTGPHLHYEVRYYGKQVNPSTMKFPPGKVLAGNELRLFHNLLESNKAAFSDL